jgi:hypothetical protein
VHWVLAVMSVMVAALEYYAVHFFGDQIVGSYLIPHGWLPGFSILTLLFFYLSSTVSWKLCEAYYPAKCAFVSGLSSIQNWDVATLSRIVQGAAFGSVFAALHLTLLTGFEQLKVCGPYVSALIGNQPQVSTVVPLLSILLFVLIALSAASLIAVARGSGSPLGVMIMAILWGLGTCLCPGSGVENTTASIALAVMQALGLALLFHKGDLLGFISAVIVMPSSLMGIIVTRMESQAYPTVMAVWIPCLALLGVTVVCILRALVIRPSLTVSVCGGLEGS